MGNKSTFDTANVSDAKNALLEKWRMGSYKNIGIPKGKGKNSNALSYAQKRLWFLEQLVSGTSVYCLPSAVRLKGNLNISAVHYAMNQIIKRHETLRMEFVVDDGRPVQRVREGEPFVIPLVDLRNVPEARREEQANRLIEQKVRQPFRLNQGPLIRGMLLCLDDEDYIFLLTMHHIVADGWSWGILHQEFIVSYHSFLNNSAADLEELPIQYADFTAWQSEKVETGAWNGQLEYWKEQLKGVAQCALLPHDHQPPLHAGYSGKRCALDIPGTVLLQLKEIGAKTGTTLYMVLLTALNILLYRYSGNQTITIGCPIANRNQKQIETLIGFFINTLVIRTDLDGDRSFHSLLQQVKATTLDAYSNQDIPFECVVEGINPDRDQNRLSPLFQVGFVFQNTPFEEMAMAGLTMTPIQVFNGSTQYELLVSLTELRGRLSGFIEYSTDLFDDGTIHGFASHFLTILQSVIHNGDTPIKFLKLLPDEECDFITSSGKAKKHFKQDVCLHERFEEIVRQYPERIACSFEQEDLTYGELNHLADILCIRLIAKGMAAETLVGIYMDRSLEMIVSILAVLKSGGAYVPMDTAYPSHRIAFMIQDTGMKVLLTQKHLLGRLKETGDNILIVDIRNLRASRIPMEKHRSYVRPDNLSYVIYTSGSTGQPKGVLIEHRNVIRLFESAKAWFAFDEQDVWTLFHSYAFDFSVWELWGALLHGGRLVIVPYMVTRSPEDFYHLLSREKVTVLNQTPSAFKQLLMVAEERPAGELEQLRYIIFGGEPLEFSSLKPWFDADKAAPQLVNMYGITETTVHVTYRLITKADTETDCASSIGVPLPDLDIYLLDDNHELVPVGIPGEIYVGGAGVSRGYLNRSRLTQERFIGNPFGGDKGGRLYRTGDCAKLNWSGEFEYIGRLDDQVKIRGFRLELGEIAAVLEQHDEVRNALVVPDTDGIGNTRLVAYIIAGQTEKMQADDNRIYRLNATLRDYLSRRLPEYMVPAACMVVENFPLTSNGKIDKKALPAPDMDSLTKKEAKAEELTDLENRMIEIWKGVLGVSKLGLHDKFFDLGGHSLMATKLIYQVRDILGIKVPLRAFFKNPTISGMMAIIQPEESGSTGTNSVNLRDEAVLPFKIRKDMPSNSAGHEWGNVLLTGATGFLGAFLLRDLLRFTTAKIHCLVRGLHHEDGFGRLKNNLIGYGIWEEEYSNRIQIITGDLRRGYFGLLKSSFMELADKIDAIYHCGSQVNFVIPYSDLKGANVNGTIEIIQLANYGRLKEIHYISTTHVFTPNDAADHIIYEATRPDHPEELTSGYTQSKWVAERILTKARKEGLNINIYRPGRIWGDQSSGSCQTSDFLWLVIKASIEMQKIPDIKMNLDILPVDFASSAIIRTSIQNKDAGKPYHLVNPNTFKWEEVLAAIEKKGYILHRLPMDEWIKELNRFAAGHEDHASRAIVSLFQYESDGSYGEDLRMDCHHLMESITNLEMEFPRMDLGILETYLNYFIKIGFLPGPAVG